MRKAWFVALLALGCSVFATVADTVQLKGQGAIIGTILAEKRDAVVVDLGYTVLVIPRNQVSAISRDTLKVAKKPSIKTVTVATPTAESAPPATEAQRGLYAVASGSSPVKNVRELVEQLGQAVVQVKTPSALGSGFFINEDGFLLTNFHVIEGETQISVEVYHQRAGQLERKTYKQVRIVAINKFEDMALLKIEDKDAPKFVKLRFGSADALAVGERVFAIGSPMGLERTVTEGILSTKTRQLQGALYLQTTTQINPGNSGGPLFNLTGDVVGITNMKITFGEGLGFAIPIEAAKFFLDHRDAYAYANDNPSNPFRYLEPPSRTRHAAPPE
jgi:serine protease Do